MSLPPFVRLLYALAGAIVAIVPVQAKVWTLSDSTINVQFDDRTALLQVTDKRAGKTWSQVPFKNAPKVMKTERNGDALIVSLSGAIPFTATISLGGHADLRVSVRADQAAELDRLWFPSAFKSPDQNHYLLLTNSEGILVPMDDTRYPLDDERIFYCGGGLAMAWLGVTDFRFETGYMTILETPHDAALVPSREQGQVVFRPLWRASMGKFGYERKLRYVFFDRGGYVAQAKAYREYAWKTNRVISLKSRLAATPALDKMVGAIHMYLWNDARETSFAGEMKAAGIDRAFVVWDQNHRPYPAIGYDNALKKLGYAAGVYDIYTDLHDADKTPFKVDENGPWRFKHGYPGLFDELVLRTSDGSTQSNQFGHTISPSMVRPQIVKRIDRAMKEYPHEAYLLDVYGANGTFEDYSPAHRLTRRQFAKEVIKNHQLVADRYKVYLGAEWGADYLAGQIAFAHGMMTLQRTWWGTGIDRKNSIYYTGDWDNEESPSQMVGTRTANDAYLKYSLNEYTRVPLYELVYHDAIVTSWRWEDANHHTPETWWKKDLFNVLYGTAPLWNMDRNRWNAYRATFVDSYRRVAPWLRRIGYDELRSHRFVTADHKVQESVFSSGGRVIVNFGAEDVTIAGKLIPAKGFVTFEK